MPELQIAPELTLPLEVVTESIAILAVKRAGKSNAAVVMAEQMYDAQVPWVAIDPKGDWWGVRSNQAGDGPGLEVIVFGGEHADVPLEPTAGNLVADLIVDERLTCYFDGEPEPDESTWLGKGHAHCRCRVCCTCGCLTRTPDPAPIGAPDV